MLICASKEGRFTPDGSNQVDHKGGTSGGKPPFLTCNLRERFWSLRVSLRSANAQEATPLQTYAASRASIAAPIAIASRPSDPATIFVASKQG